MEELRQHKQNGVDTIIFYDDLFTADTERVKDFCHRMLEEKLNLKWCCWSRTNTFTDDSMLSLMHESGCYSVNFGCESVHNKTLDFLDKGVTHEQNVLGIKKAAQHGIPSFSSFMLGLPNETAEEMKQTILFATRSSLTFAVFPIFDPVIGTPIYEDCKRLGAWENGIWSPHSCSREEIVKLAKYALWRFYLTSPRRLYKLTVHVLFRLSHKRSVHCIKAGAGVFFHALFQKNKDRTSENARY